MASEARKRGRARWWWAVLGLLAALVVANAGLSAYVYGDLPGRVTASPMTPIPVIGGISAQRCRTCHAAHFEEWSASNHGHAFTDPLYQHDLIEQNTPYFCNHCHAPLVEQQPFLAWGLWRAWPKLAPIRGPNRLFDEDLQREGVTCVVCHQDQGVMRGPFANAVAPHPTRTTNELRSEALCAPCHTLDFPRLEHLQRPLMETVTEWRAYRAAGGDRACVDCHMPRMPEPRVVAVGGGLRPSVSHRLRGPFDADFVRTAVVARDGSVTRDASGVHGTVTLTNGTGHRLPTAEPHRRVDVALELLNAAGSVVGSAVQRLQRPIDLDALREAPGSETTLAPRETRTFQLTVRAVPSDAVSARVVVRFWRWSPENHLAVHAPVPRGELAVSLYESAPFALGAQ